MTGWAAVSKITKILAVLLLFVASFSIALADQVTLSYIDAESNAQTLTIDLNSSPEDMALAAALLREDGVGVIYDPDNGSGTLAEIAAAMAGATLVFAADIALVLSSMSPADTDAIVAAINAVPGVNTKAVLAAVHCLVEGSMTGATPEVSLVICFTAPPVHESVGSNSTLNLELMEIERVPSRN